MMGESNLKSFATVRAIRDEIKILEAEREGLVATATTAQRSYVQVNARLDRARASVSANEIRINNLNEALKILGEDK